MYLFWNFCKICICTLSDEGYSIGNAWDGRVPRFLSQRQWAISFAKGRFAGSTSNILRTIFFAGSETWFQFADVMSISPLPMRDRIMAGGSFAPVAKGVFLQEKKYVILKLFSTSYLHIDSYPDNIVYRMTPRDQISHAASYPCFRRTSGATKFAV